MWFCKVKGNTEVALPTWLTEGHKCWVVYSQVRVDIYHVCKWHSVLFSLCCLVGKKTRSSPLWHVFACSYLYVLKYVYVVVFLCVCTQHVSGHACVYACKHACLTVSLERPRCMPVRERWYCIAYIYAFMCLKVDTGPKACWLTYIFITWEPEIVVTFGQMSCFAGNTDLTYSL